MIGTRGLQLIGLALLLAGCESCGSADEPVTDPSTHEATSSGTATVIEGYVRLAEGAETPQYADNPLVAPSPQPAIPEACPAPSPRDRQPLSRSEGRGLSNVLVALHDFSTTPEREPVTHEMTITECRLSPPIVVAIRGDRLRLTNETDYPFMPDFGDAGGIRQAVLHGASREVELGQGGVHSLGCGFTAPCGRSEIITLYHPLYAVTDAEGHFRIENVPPGEEVRVSAWHPLVEEASTTVTAQAGQLLEVELTVRPAEVPTPEPTDAPDTSETDGADVLF